MRNNKSPEPTEQDIERASKSTAQQVYEASDGCLTVAFYRRLCAIGPLGTIAMNLMRAQKTSTRAKKYRGTKYRSASYDVKNYSLDQLCAALEKDSCGLIWGWGSDSNTLGFPWVLYVELPNIGQVSFHAPSRGIGPNYSSSWDNVKGASEERILMFCDKVFTEVPA